MTRDNNGLTWFNRNWRILTTIATILVTIGVLYAKMDINSERTEKTAMKADANEKAIIVIQTDIGYIKESTKEIKAIQQKILDEVKK